MNVLITGGAGFIGSHLVDLHMDKGDRVIVVDNLSTGSLRNIEHHTDHPDFIFYEASMEDWEELGDVIRSVDLVYHMAAVVGVKHVLESPTNVVSGNITATERLMAALVECNSGASIIIASSSEVYGFNEAMVFSEKDDLVLPSTDRLRWCYAFTKLADEILGFSYYHQYGLKTIIVRLFNTVGERQRARYGMVLPHFIAQASSGEPITIYGDGKQTRSFCDVRDTSRMLYTLIQQERAYGQIVNVGADREISINELAQLVKQRANSNSEIKYMDYEEAYGMDFRDIVHRRPDLSRLHDLTGCSSELSLEDTIDFLLTISKGQ